MILEPKIIPVIQSRLGLCVFDGVPSVMQFESYAVCSNILQNNKRRGKLIHARFKLLTALSTTTVNNVQSFLYASHPDDLDTLVHTCAYTL